MKSTRQASENNSAQQSSEKKIKINNHALDAAKIDLNNKIEKIRQIKSAIVEESESLNVKQDEEFEKSGTYSIEAAVKAASRMKDEIDPLLSEILQYMWKDKNNHALVLQGVKIAIEFMNPNLTDSDLYAQEVNKLENCIELCKVIIKTSVQLNSKLHHEADEHIKNIRENLLPYIAYEYARLFDIYTKIENLKYESIADISLDENVDEELLSDKREQINRLIGLDNVNIKNINNALKLTTIPEYQDALNNLYINAYENLGDHQFCLYDLIDEDNDKQQISMLSAVMDSYKEVYAITGEHIIFYSLMNASYLLAEKYQKIDKKKYLQEIAAILSDIEEKEINFESDLRSENPEHIEGIQYILDCSSKACKMLKKSSYKTRAVALLKIIYNNIDNVKDVQTQNDLIGCLNHYAVIFGVPEYANKSKIKFTMASENEDNFLNKRYSQAKTAINQLHLSGYSTSNLYEHQKEAIGALAATFNSNIFSGYFHLPTGAGKTIIMIQIALSIRMPTLIIVPQTNLVEQTIEQLRKWGGPLLDITRFDGKRKKVKTFQVGDICVSSYQMLTTGLSCEGKNKDKYQETIQRLDSYGLILFDEAHRALSKSHKEIYDKTPNAVKLGFTATPDFNNKRLKGNLSTTQELFQHLIYNMTLVDAINKKVLCPVKNIIVKAPSIDFNKLKQGYGIKLITIKNKLPEVKKLQKKEDGPALILCNQEYYFYEKTKGLIQVDKSKIEAYPDLVFKGSKIFISPISTSNYSNIYEEIKNKCKFPKNNSDARKVRKKDEDDYNDNDLQAFLNENEQIKIPVDLYRNAIDPDSNEKVYGKSTIIFCAGVDHAEILVNAFNNAFIGEYPDGIAACVLGETPSSERERIFTLHREKQIPILIGCGVFTEGYDNPADEVTFNIRPTKSIILEVQRSGRVLRKCEGQTSKAKKYATVFDWSYGIDQLYFRDFLENNYSVGFMGQSSATTTTATTTTTTTNKINNMMFDSKQKCQEFPALHYTVCWDGSLPVYQKPLQAGNQSNPSFNPSFNQNINQDWNYLSLNYSNPNFNQNFNFAQFQQMPQTMQNSNSSQYNHYQVNYQPAINQQTNYQPASYQSIYQQLSYQPSTYQANYQQPAYQPSTVPPASNNLDYNNSALNMDAIYNAQLPDLFPEDFLEDFSPQTTSKENQVMPTYSENYSANVNQTFFGSAKHPRSDKVKQEEVYYEYQGPEMFF